MSLTKPRTPDVITVKAVQVGGGELGGAAGFGRVSWRDSDFLMALGSRSGSFSHRVGRSRTISRALNPPTTVAQTLSFTLSQISRASGAALIAAVVAACSGGGGGKDAGPTTPTASVKVVVA